MGTRSLALLVLLGFLVLCVLAAYFARREPGGGRQGGATEPSPEEGVPVELAEPDLVESAVEAGRLDVAEPRVAAAPAIDSPVLDTLVLEVIDGRTNSPARGVKVRYATLERPRMRKCLSRTLSNSLDSVRTDGDGLARLPVARSTAVEVVATRLGLVGEATFAALAPDDARERRERLLLWPDWDLVVEIVDDAQQSAAWVPLRLATSAGEASLGLRNSGLDGRVIFRKVGHELHCNPGQALRVSVTLPLENELAAIVEREPHAGEPVRLQLPPLGSVEVEVRASDGAPVADGTVVELRPVKSGERAPAPLSMDPVPHPRAEGTRSGRARFEYVVIGRELELTAECLPERGRTQVSGPQRFGERVQATLRLALQDTLLCFRALDPAGRPIVAALETSVRTGGGGSWRSQSSSTSPDPEGRFEVRLEVALAEGDRRVLEVNARELGFGATIDLGRAFPAGRIDMGELVLESAPLVAEGRVLDAAGRPVKGAYVTALPALDGGGWSRLGATAAPSTDAEGAFAMRGFVEARRVRLLVQHERLKHEPLEVEVGARGLEIVMNETGAVAGRLILDPGVPMWHAIELRPQGMPDALGSIHMRTEDDGRFECLSIPSGTYTLSVALDDTVLAEVPGVVVPAGEVARDPRIQEIDLRGRLSVYRIELVPPSPGFTLQGTVTHVESGSAGRGHVQFLNGKSVLELVTPLAHIDATLCVFGCRIERLTHLGPHTEVQLRPGYPVLLVLPRGARLPEPPLFLGASLSGPDWCSFGNDAGFFDEHGEALVQAPEAGRMGIRWLLERRHQGGGGRSVLEAANELYVTVEDRPGEQRFELAITPAELHALVQSR